MTQHAKLSASGAHRWLNCPPSAHIESKYPNTSSVFAQEGSFAHELAELKLNLEYKYINKREYNSKFKLLKTNEYYSEELEEYVNGYVDSVIELVNESKKNCKDVLVEFEQKLDFSDYVPEGFGTGDVVIIGDDTLQIVDLKYGKGVEVSALDNPQLRLYGLGAYLTYGCLYDINKVKMTIIQPRLDNISTEVIEVKDLLNWADKVKEIAELAFKGEGELKAGDHCKFCKAKAECKERAKHNLDVAKKYDFKDGFSLTPLEIADILFQVDEIQSWIKDIKEFALNEATKGVKYPGFKLVEGRSNRQYKDKEEVIKILQDNGYEDIYKPQELKGITDMTKLLGKKKFETILADLIIKPQGKPTLVPMSDPRSELISIDSAKDDFKDDIEMEIPF